MTVALLRHRPGLRQRFLMRYRCALPPPQRLWQSQPAPQLPAGPAHTIVACELPPAPCAQQLLSSLQRPPCSAACHPPRRHVLVDEFQDTNTAQYALVNLLVGPQVS